MSQGVHSDLCCAHSSSDEDVLRSGLPANGYTGSPVVKPAKELSQIDVQRSHGHCATPRQGETM